MRIKKGSVWLSLIILGMGGKCFAADASVQLTTSDGSTKFSIQNSAAVEISSIDSQGNAAFNKVTATNLNATTLRFTDGTTQTTAGTLNGITAGIGLSGGGTSGNVVVNLASNSTNYIQNTSSVQPGAIFNVSSGTVSGKLTAGSLQIPAGEAITAGSVRGTIVPSGTLILTTATLCPTGFTEYSAAGGFYLVGVPPGGSVGQTVGSAMTDLSNAPHNHTVTSTTANLLGGLTSAVTSVTSPTGDVARGAIAPFFQIRLCSVP